MTHLSTAKKFMAIAALSLAGGFTASADEIYTYTGPTPANLSGSFETPSLIGSGEITGVISFAFTDGVDVWTPANSSFAGTVLVNPDGSFLVWAFNLLVNGQTVAYSQTMYSPFYYQDDSPVGDSWTANQFSYDKPKGSWTMADPVASPEPSVLLLLVFGLALLALRGKRA